jgi:hypothetical protein
MDKVEDVVADVFFNDQVICDVSCRIITPKKGFGNLLIKIDSENEELLKMFGCLYFTVLVKSFTLSGSLYRTIKSGEIYIYHNSHKTIGLKDSYIVEGRAQSLTYKFFRDKTDINPNSSSVGDFRCDDVNELMFYISDSNSLSPKVVPNIDCHGNVEIKKSKFIEFETSCGKEIKFDQYYYSDLSDGVIELRPYLVATVKSKVDDAVSLEGDSSNYIDLIESVLHLVSFVEGRRVSWGAWSYEKNKTTVRYIRGNTLSSGEETRSSNDGLIDAINLSEFLGHVFDNFHSTQYKKAITGAIGALNSAKTMPIETYFMSLFQSLESIILTYRKNNGAEYILNKKDWSSVKRKIEKTIKKIEGVNVCPSDRNRLYCKLNELNRIPLQDAFNEFSENTYFSPSSPWPLFKSGDVVGLVWIRNMLAHGNYFPNELLKPLFVAGECLKLTLQELIFKVLGWELSNSTKFNNAATKLMMSEKHIEESIILMTKYCSEVK